MSPYTLYYYIPWPDSQVWMGEDYLKEQGYVIGSDDNSCFVDKDVADNRNGL